MHTTGSYLQIQEDLCQSMSMLRHSPVSAIMFYFVAISGMTLHCIAAIVTDSTKIKTAININVPHVKLHRLGVKTYPGYNASAMTRKL